MGSVACNGTSNPIATSNRSSPGLVFTTVYSATGVLTITLDPTLALPAFPECITVTPQCATLATDWFDCAVLGEFNVATRSFQIQMHRSGVGQAPAVLAGNRVNFTIKFRNSTSR
ncbi:MAG: hypothetical protein ACRCU1_11555 [Alsobacter sp.]